MSAQLRDLYHGTNGDNILEIIQHGSLAPGSGGKIFFSERRFDSVLMHGADKRRNATFAVKLRVTIPSTASVRQTVTPGVADTLVVTTTTALPAEVLELYVRQPHATTVQTIAGKVAIVKYLSI